uniref:Putative N-acetylneuraminate synthase n=1 Tax=viral metagenome TaxID=1070528 RepID=A0A6H1ZFP2_9ZZZZ
MSIICEIGQNFCSDLELAKKLILLAKENGGDLAKFQLYDTDKLYTPDTELYRLAKESELTQEQAQMLFSYGESIGMEVFFSVFDVEKVMWCEDIGVKRYKIACRDVENYSLQLAVLGTDKPVFMSLPYGKRPQPTYYFRDDHFTFLYCVPEYPSPLDKIKIHDSGECSGFSDHSIGIEVAKIYLANYRNTVIEKHFCISHNVGVDGKWSMTPKELRELKRWENVISQVL